MLLKLATFLACASVTFAVTDLNTVASHSPTQDQFLIYDIRGDLQGDDVLNAFSGLNTPYKFRVLSGHRFIVVVKKDSTNHTAYASVSFPSASQVDVYPAELISDFFEYYGVNGIDDKDDIEFSDHNLIMTEFTVEAGGVDEDTYKAEMTNLGQEYKNFNNIVQPRVFHLTARMPFEAIVFVSLPAYAYDRVLTEGDTVLGGPYQTKVVTTPLANM